MAEWQEKQIWQIAMQDGTRINDVVGKRRGPWGIRVIKDGAWRFVSNSGNENADISLEGGNLEFADGTENRLGTLTVKSGEQVLTQILVEKQQKKARLKLLKF